MSDIRSINSTTINKLVVLGGSSPFTVSLINELCAQNTSPCNLVLHGRDSRSLGLVAEYARCALLPKGWGVFSSTNLMDVLPGADIVLHQIRYGDMQGRADDEAFAERMDVAADETLGPAALRRALMLRKPLKYLCEQLIQYCPDAWVLNLTNPLSLVTSLMSYYGISNCVGLCELPSVTAKTAIQQIGLSSRTSQWSYVGLNHRGFVVGLRDQRTDGISQLARMVRNSQSNSIVGFPISVLLDLQAIPTKYFHLVQNTGAPAAGRAALLSRLRLALLDELEKFPDTTPMSLSQRNMDWYCISVVPLLNSLSSLRESVHVVNRTMSDGITREMLATVSNWQITAHRCPPIPKSVQVWIDKYEAHERAMIHLVREPSLRNIEKALALDPLVPLARVCKIANALARECKHDCF